MMETRPTMQDEVATNAPQQTNTDLKKVFDDLHLPVSVATILDLQTVCRVDLRTAKEAFPQAKAIAILRTVENKDKFNGVFDELLTINIEKDCLPFPSKTIDIILGDNAFDQVKEIAWVMHEITRSLRMGGYLILNMSNSSPQHIVPQEIIDFLNAGYPNGFEIKSRQKNQFHFLPAWLTRFLNRLFPSRLMNPYLVLQKTQPYTTGFLDLKIKTDTDEA